MLPALQHDWIMDDAMFRARFLNWLDLDADLLKADTAYSDVSTLGAAMSNLYSFFGGPEAIETLMDYGVVPWWTSPDVKISFWRPISAFTIWLDYQLFPNSAPLQHLHSILWFALAILLLTCLYRRIMGPIWIASFAALIYALDDCYYFPVAFIANRNSLVALVFCLLTLIMHDKWRRQGSITTALVAISCLALSLLSAEAGIATMAYLIAYALTLDKSKWLNRFASLAPYIAVVLIWRTAYNKMGYGTFGSDMYIDPASEPIRFLGLAAERGPNYLFTQLMGPSADLYYFFNQPAKIALLAFYIVMLVLLFLVLLPLLKKRRELRFWFVGMLLAVVPICATTASSRNLLFVGIGAMALVASFLGILFTKSALRPKLLLWRIGAWVFCCLFVLNHLVTAGASRFISPSVFSKFAVASRKPSDIECPPGIENQDLVVVNTPSPLMLLGIPAVNGSQGRPNPRAIRCLAPSFSPLEIERVDLVSLIVRAHTGNLLFSDPQDAPMIHMLYFIEDFNPISRNMGHSFKAGHLVRLPGMSVRVIALDEHSMPTEVLFTFNVPLEDATLHWVRWDWDQGCYVPFEPPVIGHTTLLRSAL